jgi:hypothetical protein
MLLPLILVCGGFAANVPRDFFRHLELQVNMCKAAASCIFFQKHKLDNDGAGNNDIEFVLSQTLRK